MDRPLPNEAMKISRMLAIVAICACIVFSYAYAGSSSSQTAYARALVKTSIGIAKNSDLDFGDAFPGDASFAVTPDSVKAAKFTVTGEPTRAYNIMLPSQLILTTGNGVGIDRQMMINRFNSSPSRTGKLNASGMETLTVGATRAAITNTQESGNYSGVFTVTVIYQ